MISDHFDAEKKHFGTDIAANPNESVLATLDGTVILSTYTAETGYLIEVQHNQDFVSVYKHCGSLLKREGDTVKGGEAIALVGNSGTLTTGPHLHFELWHRGRPVNPENTLYSNNERDKEETNSYLRLYGFYWYPGLAGY